MRLDEIPFTTTLYWDVARVRGLLIERATEENKLRAGLYYISYEAEREMSRVRPAVHTYICFGVEPIVAQAILYDLLKNKVT